MKQSLSYLNVVLFSVLVNVINSQSLAINDSNLSAHNSSILDISSTEKGVLIPRLTKSNIENITGAADGMWVYQTDENAGLYFFENTQWMKVSEDNYDNVPIGGVIDWMPYGQPLPDGFMICDGSQVNDTESPYFGSSLPNLEGKFIKSVDLSNLNTIGGSNSHNHSVNIGSRTSSNASSLHNHTASALIVSTNTESHSHSRGLSIATSEHTHNHRWSKLTANENWWSYTRTGSDVMLVNWSDGIGADGSGNYPIARAGSNGISTTTHFYTNNHSHSHIISGFVTSDSKSHSHTLTLPEKSESNTIQHAHTVSLGTTNTADSSHTPLNVSLLKIMRIK